jgi:hypothetical protein
MSEAQGRVCLVCPAHARPPRVSALCLFSLCLPRAEILKPCIRSTLSASFRHRSIIEIEYGA